MVWVHCGAEAGAILGLAELVCEVSENKISPATAILLQSFRDRVVVLINNVRREGPDEHRIRVVVRVQEHDTVLGGRKMKVGPAHNVDDGLEVCELGFLGGRDREGDGGLKGNQRALAMF